MNTLQSTAALSTESLERITDRTNHALEHTERLQALCRTIGEGSPSSEDEGDDRASDLRKIVAGMSLTLTMIHTALEDVCSVLPGDGAASDETDQDAVSRNGRTESAHTTVV